MESMNISLPEGLRDFVHEQVATGYGSVSEYIRELIRADQLKKQQDPLSGNCSKVWQAAKVAGSRGQISLN